MVSGMAAAMKNHLADFIRDVKNAPTDARAEKMVRYMLEDMAKDCPMSMLIRLGQCLIECRKDELREEASMN